MPRGIAKKFFLFRKTKDVKYSSAVTRKTTLQGFMGNAELADSTIGLNSVSSDIQEDLIKKFCSGTVGASRPGNPDLPSAFPSHIVSRKIEKTSLDADDEKASWIRRGGMKI